MIPLLPPGAIFHSSVSSKLAKRSRVTMSLAGPTRVKAPSTTCQPEGIESERYPRHPAVDLPSNSARQSLAGAAAATAGARLLWLVVARVQATAKNALATAVASTDELFRIMSGPRGATAAA